MGIGIRDMSMITGVHGDCNGFFFTTDYDFTGGAEEDGASALGGIMV